MTTEERSEVVIVIIIIDVIAHNTSRRLSSVRIFVLRPFDGTAGSWRGTALI